MPKNELELDGMMLLGVHRKDFNKKKRYHGPVTLQMGRNTASSSRQGVQYYTKRGGIEVRGCKGGIPNNGTMGEMKRWEMTRRGYIDEE